MGSEIRHLRDIAGGLTSRLGGKISPATSVGVHRMTRHLIAWPKRRCAVVQHGFYARPRLYRWNIVWFAATNVPLSPIGWQRRGHRLFGNAAFLW